MKGECLIIESLGVVITFVFRDGFWLGFRATGKFEVLGVGMEFGTRAGHTGNGAESNSSHKTT